MGECYAGVKGSSHVDVNLYKANAHQAKGYDDDDNDVHDDYDDDDPYYDPKSRSHDTYFYYNIDFVEEGGK